MNDAQKRVAIDRFGRMINYLRISLTDKCNLRCVYCMPEDMVFRPNHELMQDDELRTLVNVFAELGFKKFRLTGGEPTVRQNIVEICRFIAQTPGVKSLSMTTNGLLLKDLAQPLADAGLQRVNVSIDTLDPVRFKKITRWGSLAQVWEGVDAAERAGLTPVKLNAVVVRGFNDRGRDRTRQTDARSRLAGALHRNDALRRCGNLCSGADYH